MRIWKKGYGWIKLQETVILDSTNKIDNTEVIKQPLSTSLEFNMTLLRKLLGDPQDLSTREFTVASDIVQKAAIISIEGLAQRDLINEQVLKALMLDIRFTKPLGPQDLFNHIKKYGITNVIIKEVLTVQEVLSQVLSGDTVFFLDGVDRGLMVASRGWEDRSVSEPITEAVVRGPRDGFTETLRTNTGLIRRRIRSPDLRLQSMKIGKLTQTDVLIVYLEGVASKEVVAEVNKRLGRIKIDGVLESGYLEEFLEDNPMSPFPQIQHTERPDKVAAAILEGRIAIMVDTTPFVLIVPTVFFQFMQASEDYYERYYIGSLTRMIRLLAYVLSLILPALFVALTSFHQEMLPTSLALSIAASREGVPVPAIGEALLMGVTFEIMREAGVRLPQPTGQAVSIVGGLVIGTAAVEAGLVSQALVILIALTAVSSFAIPAYNLSIAGQLPRLLLAILAAVLGLFGILAGLSVILIHMCSLQSFGVRYLFPFSSAVTSDYQDLLIRSPWWTMLRRPSRLSGKDKKRI